MTAAEPGWSPNRRVFDVKALSGQEGPLKRVVAGTRVPGFTSFGPVPWGLPPAGPSLLTPPTTAFGGKDGKKARSSHSRAGWSSEGGRDHFYQLIRKPSWREPGGFFSASRARGDGGPSCRSPAPLPQTGRRSQALLPSELPALISPVSNQ